MALMHMKDRIGAFRVPHCFRLCYPQNLTIINVTLFTVVSMNVLRIKLYFSEAQKWPRVRELNTTLRGYSPSRYPWRNNIWTQAFTCCTAKSRTSTTVMQKRIYYNCRVKPLKTRALQRRFNWFCKAMWHFFIWINNCKRKTTRTLSRKNMTASQASLCSMKYWNWHKPGFIKQLATSGNTLQLLTYPIYLFNFQRFTLKHEKFSFKCGV